MLQELPTELICHIFHFLSPGDLAIFYIYPFHHITSPCAFSEWINLGILGLDWSLRNRNKELAWLSLQNAEIKRIHSKSVAKMLLKKAIITADIELVRSVLVHVERAAIEKNDFQEIINTVTVCAMKHKHSEILEMFHAKYTVDYECIVYASARMGDCSLLDYNPSSSEEHERIIYQAARGGHKDLVDALTKGHESIHYGQLLIHAARSGNKELVISLLEAARCKKITMLPDFCGALAGAAEKGHLELCRFIVEGEYVNNDLSIFITPVVLKCYYDIAMLKAAENGHWEVCDYFEEKGGTDWNAVLYGAVKFGRKDLIEKYVNKGITVFNLPMKIAATFDRQDLVEYFVEKGANNWDEGLAVAINNDHFSLVQYYVRSGKANIDNTLKMLTHSPGYHFEEIMVYLVNNGLKDFNYGLYLACYHGYAKLARLFLSKGGSLPIPYSWDGMMVRAFKIKCPDVVHICLEMGTVNRLLGLYRSIRNGYWDLIVIFADKTTIRESDIVDAVHKWDTRLLRLFICRGITPDNYMMDYALRNGDLETLEFLVENGAPIKKKLVGFAYWLGLYDTVDYLCEKSGRATPTYVIEIEKYGYTVPPEYRKPMPLYREKETLFGSPRYDDPEVNYDSVIFNDEVNTVIGYTFETVEDAEAWLIPRVSRFVRLITGKSKCVVYKAWSVIQKFYEVSHVDGWKYEGVYYRTNEDGKELDRFLSVYCFLERHHEFHHEGTIFSFIAEHPDLQEDENPFRGVRIARK